MGVCAHGTDEVRQGAKPGTADAPGTSLKDRRNVERVPFNLQVVGVCFTGKYRGSDDASVAGRLRLSIECETPFWLERLRSNTLVYLSPSEPTTLIDGDL